MGDRNDIPDNSLIETIRSVAEIVKASEVPLSREETAEYFKDMELSEKQTELIYQYLQELLINEQNTAESVQDHQDTENEVELPKSMFFQMYLKDLEGIRPCSFQEEEKLYEQLIAGDSKAVQKLSDQWLLKVFELAKKSTADSKELADVIQEGNIGVFLALQRMLGSNNRVDFHKVLTEAARGAMDAYLSDTAAAEDMDNSLLAKAALVYEAQKFLAEKLMRVPTTEELSQYTRLSEEELEDILALKFSSDRQ